MVNGVSVRSIKLRRSYANGPRIKSKPAYAQAAFAQGMISVPLVVRELICHGVVASCAVMFMGGGSAPGVSFASSPGRVSTPPLPAPCALRFGAVKGTKAAEAEVVSYANELKALDTHSAPRVRRP